MNGWRWLVISGVAVACVTLLNDLTFLERSVIVTFALVGYGIHTLGQAIDAARAETAALRHELREQLVRASIEHQAGLDDVQRTAERIERHVADLQPAAGADDSRF